MLAWASSAAAQAQTTEGAAAERIREHLGQHELPPAPLLCRQIDLEVRHAVALTRYRHAHPRVSELDAELHTLDVQLEGAPRAPAEERREALLECLYGSMTRASMEAARARGVYGPRHPRLMELELALRLREVSVAALQGDRSEDRSAEAMVRRTEIEARLSVLTERYADRHPRVLAARAALSRLGAASAPPSCAALARARAAARARLRASIATRDPGIQRQADEAALRAVASSGGESCNSR